MTSSNTRTQVELQALITEFDRVRAELIEAVLSVPRELRDVAFVGIWDLRDVIAHTVGWDYTNIEALPDFRAGRLPVFFARYDTDWAAINADLIARYRLKDWDALVASLRESQTAFTGALRDLSDVDLDNVALWGKRRITLRGMMRAVSRDESEHVAQIRALVSERAR
ncbi:MAG TPA: DinB family protein [Dehalococcoidia bacterium]|nr:DinB family protein [Dehalococcoidia bacterium]